MVGPQCAGALGKKATCQVHGGVMSRYLNLTALRPVWRMSVAHGDDFPLCHGLQAAKMDLNGGAFRTGG